MKDIKYIVKRIIIGVSIALLFYLIKGNFLMVVNAANINFTPYDIVIDVQGQQQYISPVYQNWDNRGIYAFPANTPTDWNGRAIIYFRYNTFNNSNYCYETSNNGSISGSVYNGNTNIYDDAFFKIEDTVNNTKNNCTSSISGTRIDFVCNDVNLSHNLNLIAMNVNPGRYGVTQQLNISCSMTNEGLANSINQNSNNNTQNIINNQNSNTQNIINNQNSNTNKINDTLTDDNVDDASDLGDDFFSDFSSNSHGLSGIITSPIRLLNSLTTATCSPLEFNLPFVHNHVVLPCPRPILEQHFGVFFTLWQLITTGLISYRVCINLYSKVHDLQNPNNDRIEVLNL